MTLEEKLMQMTQLIAACLTDRAQATITGPTGRVDFTEAQIASVGSTLNLIGAAEMKAIQKAHLERDPHAIPLLFMMDVIHGYRTIYPIPLAMGATFDTSLMEKCCAMAARESAAAGVQVTFGPMVDLVRDARWGRVMESTGEDPYLNCLMSRAQVRGFQHGNEDESDNISACVKHYAAYGAAEAGRDYTEVNLSEHALREFYLPAYRAAIDEGVDMLMTAFNLLNGIPTAGHKWLINDILRGEWGFDGTIITDYSSLVQMKTHGYTETAFDCGRIGLETTTDIEMMSATFLEAGAECIKRGYLTEADIDKSLRRILDLKEKHGLFDNPYGKASEELEDKLFLSEEHRAICRTAAEKSMVLLKNDGVLPIKDGTKNVAVIGPLAKCGMIGFWSCAGRAEEAVSAYDGISAIVGEENVRYAVGCSSAVRAAADPDMIAAAKEAAEGAEYAILVLGEEREMSGESNSKTDISLPEAQRELIRAVSAVNKNTVVVLYTGRPLALADVIDDAPAYMIAWQPGTEGGTAIANLLFGKCDFTARLPMSFPYYTGQCPIFYNRTRTGRPKPKNDGKHYIYTSSYLDSPVGPLFPFGYGLSYTRFEIGEVSLSSDKMARGGSVTAKATVKNTGSRRGTTLVQLYINDRFASIVRPMQELRGFMHVELDAGEAREVSFEITEDMLKFHTASGEYSAESGEFGVYVALSAESGKAATFVLE